MITGPKPSGRCAFAVPWTANGIHHTEEPKQRLGSECIDLLVAAPKFYFLIGCFNFFVFK